MATTSSSAGSRHVPATTPHVHRRLLAFARERPPPAVSAAPTPTGRCETTDDPLQLFEADRAPATRRAYRCDWQAFQLWCDSQARCPLPADAQTVRAWLEDQAAAGYAVATIQRRLVTIRQVHRQHGITSPTDAPEVAAAWTAARRRLGTAPRQVAPITIELLRRLVANCATTSAGHRDRALLVVGFAGALRRSEIAALTVNDVERQPDGLIITLRSSKSDQQRAGQRLGLPHGSRPDTCPVRSLTAWQHTADLQHGPLFRPVDRHGNIADRHLSGRAVAEIIKRRVKAVGLDPARYSGHSLRAGFATSAAAAGATEIAIARQTRHRSMTVLRGYIREGNLFRTNAATTIGL